MHSPTGSRSGPVLRALREVANPLPAQRAGSAEPACKPGSVEDSHSSRRRVTTPLQRSTRTHRGPRHGVPIRPCSGWGLPCPVALAPRAVRSYRTVSPLPRIPRHRSGSRTVRRFALCCTGRRLAPPRGYLASCPVEPGLSSPVQAPQRLSGRLRIHSVRDCKRANAPAYCMRVARYCRIGISRPDS